ncbi:MAG: DUF6541 family protein [Varibaculum cambriense]|nr:DUF6541 family protein [Varibaculum cambriense]
MDVLGIASVNDFFNSWLLFLIPLSVSVLVIFLPGLILGFAVGLRGRWLWGWAPAGSVGIIVLSAILAPKMGFTWGFPVLLLGCFIITFLFLFILWIINQIFPNNNESPLHESGKPLTGSPRIFLYLPPVAIAISFLVQTIRFARVVKVPGAFSQLWDNVFHSNLAMMFLQTGDASTIKVNLWTPGTGGFYPAAWHGIVSLVASTCSGAVTVATNAVTLIVGFVVWPLGIFCLASAISKSRVVQLAAIFLSLAMPQFPYAFLSWGPLYPNLLSCTLLPSVIAILIRLIKGKLFSLALGLVAVFWGIGSIAASQPNNIFTFAIVSVVLGWWFGRLKILKKVRYQGCSRVKRFVVLSGWALACAAVFSLWEWGTYQVPSIRGMRTQTPYWLPQGSYWSGIKELVLLTGGKPNADFTVYRPELMLPISVLFLIGMLVMLLSRKYLEVFFCWVPFAVLVLVGHAMQNLELRQYLVGIWYADSPRIYFPVAMFSILITSIGIDWVAQKIWNWITPRTSKQVQSLLVTVSLVASVPFVGNPRSLRYSWEWIGDVFAIRAAASTDSGLVDKDELKLFLQLPKLTPTDSVILGNPWEGASFAWAIGQRRAIFPTLRYATSPEPSRAFLADKLYLNSERKQICSFLKTKNVYVLNLRDAYSGAEGSTGIEKKYPSFDQLDSNLLTPVKSVGEARLYKYRGC